MISIYRLLDPETYELRYIGQTIETLKKRLGQHCVKKGKSHTVNWIKSLRKRGLTPIIELITIAQDGDEADFLETLLIKFYRGIGYRLTNNADGGRVNRGWKPTEEMNAKNAAAQMGNQNHLGHKHTKETCDRISAILTGKKQSPETIAKRVATIKELPKKSYELSNPQGETIIITNMAQYCIDSGLNVSHMRAVANGKRRQHKGWTTSKQE